jgi:hypothetical protein
MWKKTSSKKQLEKISVFWDKKESWKILDFNKEWHCII